MRIDVNGLQHHLEQTYDVAVPYRVEDFLFHDRRLARLLSGAGRGPVPPEQLLVLEEEGELNLSLYLAPKVWARVRDGARIGRRWLEDFLLALEGVSHFLYLAWSAGHDRAVSLFELELQAEVDKFVTAAHLGAQPRGGPLHRALFESIRFRPQGRPEARDRYREVNRIAAGYCRDLGRRMEQGRDHELQSELRRLYRMDRDRKRQHMERSHAP